MKKIAKIFSLIILKIFLVVVIWLFAISIYKDKYSKKINSRVAHHVNTKLKDFTLKNQEISFKTDGRNILLNPKSLKDTDLARLKNSLLSVKGVNKIITNVGEEKLPNNTDLATAKTLPNTTKIEQNSNYHFHFHEINNKYYFFRGNLPKIDKKNLMDAIYANNKVKPKIINDDITTTEKKPKYNVNKKISFFSENDEWSNRLHLYVPLIQKVLLKPRISIKTITNTPKKFTLILGGLAFNKEVYNVAISLSKVLGNNIQIDSSGVEILNYREIISDYRLKPVLYIQNKNNIINIFGAVANSQISEQIQNHINSKFNTKSINNLQKILLFSNNKIYTEKITSIIKSIHPAKNFDLWLTPNIINIAINYKSKTPASPILNSLTNFWNDKSSISYRYNYDDNPVFIQQINEKHSYNKITLTK